MQLTDTKIETIYSILKENSLEVIRNSFFLAEDQVSAAKFDVQFSGSTSVIVFVLGNKILCANAGDSRAILINESRRKLSNKNYSKFFV
jgi:serine/threonine protein phosphatase PrpC